MSHSHEEEYLTDDLKHVSDVLRDGRPSLDPLALDRVKLRAMKAARRSSSQPKGFHMKQRLTTLLTVGFLVLGTGGTLALAGGGDGKDGGGSASFHQYKPPGCEHGKGRGEDCHKGEGGGKGGKDGGGSGGQGGGQGGGDKGGGGGDKGGHDHGGHGSGGDKGGHGHR
jgi:hypothetical protein